MKLYDFLDFHKQIDPEKLCLITTERKLTYAQVFEESIRLSQALLNSGLKLGDRAAILSKNSAEYIIFYYACARIGVVSVPLNFRLAAMEWKYILNDSNSQFLFCETEFLSEIIKVSDQLNSLKFVLTSDDETATAIPEKFKNTSYSKFIQSEFDSELQARFESVSDQLSSDDIVYQMYTSGTTGHPKGVLISHNNVAATLSQLAKNTAMLGLGGQWLVVLPVFHAAAALYSFSGIHSGATLHIEPEFIPSQFVDVLEKEKIKIALTVPAMMQALVDYVPDLGARDFSHLELFLYGASPINEKLLRQVMDAFQCDFCQGYGMTEATLAVSMLRPDAHKKAVAGSPHLLSSAGQAVLGTQISIRDNQDNNLAPNNVGEICVKGPQVMQSYWQLPEASEKSIKNGWLYTGDAGYLDEEGYLYLVDRVKDMIISGGENIYPKEIETALLQHPSVKEVAVIGIPSEKWGETPLAFIVLEKGEEYSKESLDEHSRNFLAKYKCPSAFEVLEELPLNATGKVLKKVLRAPYWEGKDRKIS